MFQIHHDLVVEDILASLFCLFVPVEEHRVLRNLGHDLSLRLLRGWQSIIKLDPESLQLSYRQVF